MRAASADAADAADATSTSSPSSSELSCRHFRDCSGCSLSDGLAVPPVFREASSWFRSLGVEIDSRSEKVNAHGWRCRARLAVRLSEEEGGGKNRAVAIGLFRSGTHSVSDIPDCVAHHPRISEAAQAIKSAVERLRTRVYREGRHARGGLRYLQLTAVSGDVDDDDDDDDENRNGSEGTTTTTPIHEDARAQIQLVLVWGSDGSRQPAARAEAERLARLLWEEQRGNEEGREAKAAAPPPPRLFHSIFLNWQPSPGNSVMGPSYERFAGPELAWQRIAVETFHGEQIGGGGGGEGGKSFPTTTTTSVAVALSPAAFSQANPAAFGSLVGELARFWSAVSESGEDESDEDRIVALADLHAGAGAVGLSLAAAAATLPAKKASSSSSSRPPPLAALERVIAVDCVGAGRAPLAASAALLRGGEMGEKRISVELFEARAGDDPARWLAGAAAAVVDPPRKGLAVGDPELLRVLCEAPPKGLRRFAYISCHFPSLRRDAEELLRLSSSVPGSDSGGGGESGGGEESGGGGGDTRNKRPLWRLSHGAARIFFPGADHVECLAVFERVD